jgi:hypothetical protein
MKSFSSKSMSFKNEKSLLPIVDINSKENWEHLSSGFAQVHKERTKNARKGMKL